MIREDFNGSHNQSQVQENHEGPQRQGPNRWNMRGKMFKRCKKYPNRITFDGLCRSVSRHKGEARFRYIYHKKVYRNTKVRVNTRNLNGQLFLAIERPEMLKHERSVQSTAFGWRREWTYGQMTGWSSYLLPLGSTLLPGKLPATLSRVTWSEREVSFRWI